MNKITKSTCLRLNGAALLLFFGLLLLSATPCFAQISGNEVSTPPPCDCQETVSLLKKQKKNLSHEFRQVKRELGVIKESLSKPGLTEILGGIGYILGLFGLSFYWYARNLLKERK